MVGKLPLLDSPQFYHLPDTPQPTSYNLFQLSLLSSPSTCATKTPLNRCKQSRKHAPDSITTTTNQKGMDNLDHSLRHFNIYLLPANADGGFPDPYYEYFDTSIPVQALPKHIRRLTPYWMYREWDETFIPINRDQSCLRRLAGEVMTCVEKVVDWVLMEYERWRAEGRVRAYEKLIRERER